MNEQSYSSPRGVESAIRAAAQRASTRDPLTSVSDRIRQEHFHRFLSRVFSEGDASEWVLKGGTGVLARVGTARTTRDVDLFRRSLSLDHALEDLKGLAAVDLGDFFRFEYAGHVRGIGVNQQLNAEGCQVDFDIYVGTNKRGTLKVDLVTNAVLTDELTISSPANGLEIPRLTAFEYRLYPVVDQIADKVCATLATYNGRPSTREWDLVDLVILVTTEHIDGGKLVRALSAELAVRELVRPDQFGVPGFWGRRYAKDARNVPACTEYRTVDLAVRLLRGFLDPVLSNQMRGRAWNPQRLDWQIGSISAGQ